MINEDLYRRCLEAVAPKENKRLLKCLSINLNEDPPVVPLYVKDGKPIDKPAFTLRDRVLDLLKRRTYCSADDVARGLYRDTQKVRPILTELSRSGVIMSGCDPNTKKRMYWMPSTEDPSIPYKGLSKHTKLAARIRMGECSLFQRTEVERREILSVLKPDKWMHVNSVSSLTGIRGPVARGHLDRMLTMHLVDRKKVGTKSYWTITDTGTETIDGINAGKIASTLVNLQPKQKGN